MTSRMIAIALLTLISGSLYASGVQDNKRLIEIFEEDQSPRNQESIDWKVVAEQDRARRAEVLALIKAGQINTSRDYFNAALVFQHGNSIDDYRLAMSLAQLSSTLDPQYKAAPQLVAAAWDRILMSKGVPQWYGTQFSRDAPDAPIVLYRIDESIVTDQERLDMNLPTIQEAKDRADRLNDNPG
ncbi:hypothetical protein [Lysobacter sp. A421]